MFDFIKKNNCLIYAPASGKMIDISEVPDPVFSKKMMGEGVGFIYEGDTLYSPVDGKVKVIAKTKHAIGFETKNKAEVLIHIGLNTVELNGEGFEVLVVEGDKVKHGAPIMKIDREIMKINNIDLTTPLVVTSDEYIVDIKNQTEVTIDSAVMECRED